MIVLCNILLFALLLVLGWPRGMHGGDLGGRGCISTWDGFLDPLTRLHHLPRPANALIHVKNTIFYLPSMLFRCRETFVVAQRRGAFFVTSPQHKGGKQRTAARIAWWHRLLQVACILQVGQRRASRILDCYGYGYGHLMKDVSCTPKKAADNKVLHNPNTLLLQAYIRL